MSRADLHVHSKFSNHPSEWFLQRLGASESYTEPEFIYHSAKERGMNFVTVTDHNNLEASLLLVEKYPHDCFTGVESTAYFPEDGCKVHILIYGFTERQFEEIQRYRRNIYDLRDYLFENRLAHSVAHATYSVNNRLSLSHLERLLLLFNVFEVINGGRSRLHNETLMEVLSSLNPDKLDDLRKKYRIEPIGDKPWEKGTTGGSDDHAGLFIGQTFTTAEASSPTEFLDRLRNRATQGMGRHNDYKSLAFTLYKVAYDFYRHKSGRPSSALLGKLTEYTFEKKETGLKDRLLLRRLKSSLKKNGRRINHLLSELLVQIENLQTLPIDKRLEVIYEKVADIADEFFVILLESIEKDILKGDIINLIRNLSASLPGIFLSVPFFSTLRLMMDNRQLLSDLRANFKLDQVKKPKKVLWFTDTIYDLNGVAITLQKLGNIAQEKDLPLFIVHASSPKGNDQRRLPIKEICLPSIYSFRLPGYESYLLKIPSILRSLEIIYNANPDEIIISTPGPVGLIGLLTAKLINAKTIGIYHTDFKLQTQKIIPDESISQLLEKLVRAFYSTMDEIQVPTQEYIQILESRGYDLSKMRIFQRAIDTDLFAPRPRAKERLMKQYRLKPGFNLLYVGRISKDKDLPFLLKIYQRLVEEDEKWNLLIAGDGPYFQELQRETRHYERVLLLGRVDYNALPELYSAADLFIFPSTTDTFGLVVLEAQACGLPAIVSDQGGPKEIIEDHRTGLIARAGSIDSWVEKIIFLRNVWQTNPRVFDRMKEEARKLAIQSYSWEGVIKEIFNEKKESFIRLRQQQRPEPDGRGFPQHTGRAQV